MKTILLAVIISGAVTANLFAQSCDDPKSIWDLATDETYFCESKEPVIINNMCNTYAPNLTCMAYMTLDWGDGVIDTLQPTDFANKQHIYYFPDSIACLLPTSGQEFEIALIVYYTNGRKHPAKQSVYVEPLPRAHCSANPAAVCLDPTADVQFNGSQSCHETSYLWDFGDPSSGTNNTSTEANPSHTYAAPPSTHTVRLIVEGSCGKDSCYTSVQATQAVVAVANISRTEVCVVDTVQLTSLSQNATMHHWIVTDGPDSGYVYQQGGPGSTKPILKILKPGTYTVKLTVKGACDEETIDVGTIIARTRPQVRLQGDTSGCLPHYALDVTANLLYDGNSDQVKYFWYFPGGTPALAMTATPQPPSVYYDSPGAYIVTLIAHNECGDDTAKLVLHVAAVAEAGAMFTGVPNNECGPYTVVFTNTSTGAGSDYEWLAAGATFVDGTTKDDANPHIRFSGAGNYTVTLQLPGAVCGGSGSWSQGFTVRTKPGAMLPDSLFGCVPIDVSLNPHFSDGGFPGTMSTWEATNATPSSSTQTTSPVVFHYDSSGLYSITFEAHNSCGDTLLSVAVILAERAANAEVSGVPANNCGPFTAIFTNKSLGDGANSIFWSIAPVAGSGATTTGYTLADGTGTTSSEMHVNFNKKGDYAVKLHFIGASCGLDSIWSQIISVRTKPIVTLDTIPDDCAPKTVTLTGFSFDNGGDNAATHLWTATGSTLGSSSTIMPLPVFPYPVAGNYTIQFVAANACGDTTINDHFSLHSIAPIVLAAHPDTVCKYGAVVALLPNQAGNWLPAVPFINAVNEFVPRLADSGWNRFEYRVGSDNCLVTLLDSIYVIDLPISAGPDLSACDIMGGTTLSGIPLLGGIWNGPGVVDSLTGEVIYANADFGSHTIYHTVYQQQYGCSFQDSMILAIYPKPVSIPFGPDTSCVEQVIVFENHSTGWSTWQWHFGGLNVPGGVDSTHIFPNTGAYSVVLVVNNAWCADTASLAIAIVAPPVLDFSVEPDSICPQHGVWVTNASTGEAISGFTWDFGNDSLFNGFQPGDSIYYEPGLEDKTYTITLTVAGVCPNVSASQPVVVHPLPQLYLVPSLDSTCSGDTLSFSLNTTGGSIFDLTFTAGDSTTYGLPLPNLQFFAPDDSSIVILAIVSGRNQCGLAADTALITIVPNEAKAFMDLNVPVVCVGDTLYITSGAIPLNAQVNYDFGDNSTSAEKNPKKVYHQAGVYTITQYAHTFCGYDFIQRQVRVRPAPLVDFAHDPYACAGAPMAFWLKVDSTARTMNWDFGPGGTATTFRPKAAFPSGGLYPVTLTITLDSSGCQASQTQMVEIKTNPVANFIPSDTIACGELQTVLTVVPGGGQFYGWTASDSSTSASNPATFIFSDSGLYAITLYLEDSWGCHDDTTLWTFHVLPVPESDFQMDKPWACAFPATVQLTEMASFDAIGFNWIFPDGTTSPLNNPEKKFDLPGDYPITLVVRNLYECTAMTTKLFRVFAPPIADWEITDPTPCQFEPLGINNLSQNANHWLWIFHHTDTSTAQIPSYAFQHPGTFDITLIAALDTFCYDTLVGTDIIVVNPAPQAGFFATDSMPNGYPKGLVYIFSTAIGAEKYEYDLGNGQTSTDKNPIVQYGQNKTYTIVQLVTNEWGCTDADTLEITPKAFGGLYVPNAFAPDVGDGDYAFFMPKGSGLAACRVRVYSPTGKLVFEANEVVNGAPTAKWNGDDLDGIPCQQGAYVWLIDAEYETEPSRTESLGAAGGEIHEAGSVTLIR